MSHWTSSKTTALASAEGSLKTVVNLLSFVKDGQGKPSTSERAIFAAAVVFLYGIWENYVEQQTGSGSLSKCQAISRSRGLRFTPAPSAPINNTVSTISVTASQRSPAELHASDTPWLK
jgi:hypothetical protein